MNPQNITRLNEDARKVLISASDEVKRYRHVFLKPEHLLLAILREIRPSISRVLKENKLSPSVLERNIRRSFRLGSRNYKPKVVAGNLRGREISFSKKAGSVLASKLEEPGVEAVTPSAILCGLLRKPSASLGRILKASMQARNKKSRSISSSRSH